MSKAIKTLLTLVLAGSLFLSWSVFAFAAEFSSLKLDVTTEGSKKLFGSLFSSGSVILICAFFALAVLAAVIIFVRKKKNGKKRDGDDE